MWTNYRGAGYSRLIYTNTVSVLRMPALAAALGDPVRIIPVLLTADDPVAEQRLAQREIGSGLPAKVLRNGCTATELSAGAPDSMYRVVTGDRDVVDIAAEVLPLTGWLTDHDRLMSSGESNVS